MINKKYIILFAFLLVVPFITSQLVFEEGTNINMSIPCDINGTECVPTASCNYSIFEPNSDKIKNHTTSLGINSAFYLFLNTSESDNIGTHEVHMWCENSGHTTKTIFEFEITQTGSQLTTAQGIVYVIFLVALILVFVLCLAGAIKIPFKDNRSDDGRIISVNDFKYLKIICIVFSYLLLMFIFGIMTSVSANFLFLNNASNAFEWLYWLMLSFLWPLIVLTFILTIIYLVDGVKLKKAMERGVPVR